MSQTNVPAMSEKPVMSAHELKAWEEYFRWTDGIPMQSSQLSQPAPQDHQDTVTNLHGLDSLD